MAGFYKELIAAGFGGQGVMVLGQLVAYAGMNDGHNVLWIPSYGPEMRGGTANCTTVVSEEPVGSPLVRRCDACVIFNRPSLEKFEGATRPGGVMVYNSDLIKYDKPRTDITVIPVPADTLAAKCGSAKVANVILFGVLVAASGIVTKESARKVVAEKLGGKKPEFRQMNLKALEQGFEVIDRATERV